MPIHRGLKHSKRYCLQVDSVMSLSSPIVAICCTTKKLHIPIEFISINQKNATHCGKRNVLLKRWNAWLAFEMLNSC